MTEPYPEKQDGRDIARKAASAIAGMIPLVGSLASAILEEIPPPLAKRQTEWLNELAEKLEHVTKTAVFMEDIRGGGPALDALLAAADVARKTRNEEKRQALVNCVVKTPGADSIKQSRLLMTIWRIDQMTEWHLRILRLAHSPNEELIRLGKKYQTINSSSLSGLLEAAYPELTQQKEFAQRLWKDLFSMGLLSTDQIMTMMSGSGAFASRTTELGKQIIEDCFA